MGSIYTKTHLNMRFTQASSSLLLLPLTAFAAVPRMSPALRQHRIIVEGEACPTVTGSSNFDADQYLGTWFQMAVPPFFWTPDQSLCVTAQYYAPPSGSDYDVQVVNSELEPNGQRYTSVGKAVINPDEPGTLSVAFGGVTPDSEGDNYIILDTDNVNYSFVWSCKSFCFGRECNNSPILWILNRDHNKSAENVDSQIDAALEILAGFGYSENSQVQLKQAMMVTDQSSGSCDQYYAENKDLLPST